MASNSNMTVVKDERMSLQGIWEHYRDVLLVNTVAHCIEFWSIQIVTSLKVKSQHL